MLHIRDEEDFSLGNLGGQLVVVKVLKPEQGGGSKLGTFCGSGIGEQAVAELSGWMLLPSPSLPAKPPAAQDS